MRGGVNQKRGTGPSLGKSCPRLLTSELSLRKSAEASAERGEKDLVGNARIRVHLFLEGTTGLF